MARSGNVWLGVSVENQEAAADRIPELLVTPAAVRWVSYEPALGPVDWATFLSPMYTDDGGTRRVDWLVCGAETGHGARHMGLDWARMARNAATRAHVPFFFKRDSNGNRTLDGVMHEAYPVEPYRYG
jgi:protein gp37